MTTAFRIDFVDAALIDLLNKELPTAYAAELGASSAAVDIEPLGDDDFNDDGLLVLQPPSLRVRFLGADYDTLKDNQRQTYEGALLWELLCFESSLQSRADQRRQTLVLVSVVLDQLAGARLLLSDGTKTLPISLVDVRLVDGAASGVDQLFSVRISIGGFARFSAVNANPS